MAGRIRTKWTNFERPPNPLSSSGDAAGVPLRAEAHPHALHRHQSVFSLVGGYEPAYLPSTLLLLSGDIETNPGPFMCPTCSRPWTRRTGGIHCVGCDSWTHYNILCSGVRQHRHIPQGWRCKNCHPSHNMTPSNTPPLLPSSTPVAPTVPIPGSSGQHRPPPPPPRGRTAGVGATQPLAPLRPQRRGVGGAASPPLPHGAPPRLPPRRRADETAPARPAPRHPPPGR